MNHRHHAGLFSLFVLASASAAQERLLTLEQASGRSEERVSFSVRYPTWRWHDDGVQLVSGRGDEAQLVDPSDWSERPLSEAEEDEAPAPPSARRRRGREDGLGLRLSDGQLMLTTPEAEPRPLTPAGAPTPELYELSPDGARVAYVEDNDLVVIDVANARRRDITTSGDPETFNGKLDWVYQEEVYGRGRFKGYWWSPDSNYIAYLHLDERAVDEFTLVDNVEEGHFRSRPEVVNYPKAGDPNPRVRLGVADVRNGETTWLDLSSYAESEPLVVRVDWTPDGQLAYMVQDRIQTWLDLNVADPASGSTRTWIHEQGLGWTERARPMRWLGDGSFLWLSARTGYRHVYHYAPGGELLNAVTSGEWQVESISHVDEAQRLVWFSATKDGAVNGNHYRVGLGGDELVRLTHRPGTHSLTWNAERTHFLDRWSSLADPGGVLYCNADGEVLRELAAGEVPAREEFLCSDWELTTVAARDGFELDVAFLRPAPFDESRPHPVWLMTYSGPNSPSVRNRWDSSIWNQYLAQQGIVVLQVNVRSASRKSHIAATACYRQLGVQELLDIEDAVRWLTAQPWADAARVGIAGHSYGGFMAAYALTHSELFALGIAGSGVYDWGMYDTIYTERYMQTPQLNPEGYQATSVVRGASGLSGHLVVTHGTLDDNVHYQNAIQLINALQLAGKDSFEFMPYANSRHGIRDSELRWHRRRLEWRAIAEHLTPAPPSLELGQ